MADTKVHSINFSENVHQATTYVRECGWSDFLLQMVPISGASTIIVLRFPIDWPFDDRGPLTARMAAR